MRTKKLIAFLVIVAAGIFTAAAAFDDHADSALFIPYSASSLDGGVVRAFIQEDLPWVQSNNTQPLSDQAMQELSAAYASKYGREGATLKFFDVYDRAIGGHVLWPTFFEFGANAKVDDELSVAVQNVEVFPAVTSNMKFNALDNSFSPTDIKEIYDNQKYGSSNESNIDMANELLVPRSMALVIAEVSASNGCVPSSTDFSVQLAGNMPIRPISGEPGRSMVSLGKYTVLPRSPSDGSGCVTSAWLFAFVPADGVDISNLFITFTPYDSRSTFVWTGSK